MTLIICLDDFNGYQFCERRQSADREVRRKILSLADRIRCDSYTASQFEESDRKKLCIGDDYLNTVNGTCFAERNIPAETGWKKLIVFRWNRRYPSTAFFSFPAGMKKVSEEHFTGYSHEKITMETYVR